MYTHGKKTNTNTFLVTEAEELYNHVAEIFNIWSKSQYFLKEEQNFISANEIDNMVRDLVKFLLACFQTLLEVDKNTELLLVIDFSQH